MSGLGRPPGGRARALAIPAALGWLTLLAGAVCLGYVRETWLVPAIGALPAHQVGTIAVCLLYLILISAFVRRIRPTRREAIVIGLVWVLCAVTFEFALGLRAGLSWSRMLADYDLSRGRLLPLVWLIVGAGPAMFARPPSARPPASGRSRLKERVS